MLMEHKWESRMVNNMEFFPIPSSPLCTATLGFTKKRQDQYCYPNYKHPSLRQRGYKQLKEKTQWNPYLLGTSDAWVLERALWVEFLPMLYVSHPTTAAIPVIQTNLAEVQLLERHC